MAMDPSASSSSVSVCSNCDLLLTPNSHFRRDFRVKQPGYKKPVIMSAFDALSLIFKGPNHSSLGTTTVNEDLLLCSNCGSLLEIILCKYYQLLSSSMPNSFVKRLISAPTVSLKSKTKKPDCTHCEVHCPSPPKQTRPKCNGAKVKKVTQPNSTEDLDPSAYLISLMEIGTMPDSSSEIGISISEQQPSSDLISPDLKLFASPKKVKKEPALSLKTSMKTIFVDTNSRAVPTPIVSTRKLPSILQRRPRPPKLHSNLPKVPLSAVIKSIEVALPLPLPTSQLPLPNSEDPLFVGKQLNQYPTSKSHCKRKWKYVEKEENLWLNDHDPEPEFELGPSVKVEPGSGDQYNETQANVAEPALSRTLSRFSAEDTELLKYETYKCHVCRSPSAEFDSFQKWVLHHTEVHQTDLRYGDIEKIRSSPDLKPAYSFMRPCPNCGKMFKNYSEMKLHIKIQHLKTLDFQCEICQKRFARKANVSIHKQLCHPADVSSGGLRFDPGYFLCSLCGAVLKGKGNFDQHEKSHQGLPNIECEICHKTFLHKTSLKKHKLTHTNERNFMCNKCPATFKSPATLRGHYKLQHTEKLLKAFCEVCHKGFINKSKVKDHLQGVHKFTVEDARKSSGVKGPTLFRVLENGDRIFPLPSINRKPQKKCEECQKVYVRREGLFVHMITVHGKTEEEAKKITGLESVRQKKLIPKSIRVLSKSQDD